MAKNEGETVPSQVGKNSTNREKDGNPSDAHLCDGVKSLWNDRIREGEAGLGRTERAMEWTRDTEESEMEEACLLEYEDSQCQLVVRIMGENNKATLVCVTLGCKMQQSIERVSLDPKFSILSELFQ